MTKKAIFYDPQRKRWRRIRRVLDVSGISLTLIVLFFVYSALKDTDVPTVLLAEQKKSYHALKQKEKKHPPKRGAHRKTQIPASEVELNKDEGIRGGFYVTWDAASFSSVKEYISQTRSAVPGVAARTDSGRASAGSDVG